MENKFAVIGHPIGHTMSPYIHRRLFELSGKLADYTALDIHPDTLKDSIKQLRELSGFNVTIPHKETIIPLLDSLDESAGIYGAVNCVGNTNGKLTGYSTDAYGFIKALETGGISPDGKILILGCGGAARTVARELSDRGCYIMIAARKYSLGKAAELKEWLISSGGKADISDITDINGDFDLCVNATPSGMYPHEDDMPIDEHTLSRCKALFDAIYNPSETTLMKTAQRLGIKTQGGMPMLVWQAARAHEYWYGGSFDVKDIDVIILDANKEMARIFNET